MKRFPLILLAAALILALSGCVETSADDLYALPELSEGYLKLQSAIDQILSAGAEYAAPTSGVNRQPIQREDLDGDGTPEVLAFFSVSGAERPMKIVIFQREEDEYTELARIEGEGRGIDSVSYLDMDADGVREVAVGWQMAAGLNMLSVYTVKGWQVNQVINTNYTEYTVCELTKDGGSEILALRLSQSESTGEAEHYILTGDGEVISTTARISSGAEGLERVRATPLLGGNNAIVLESTFNGNGLVTDIFAYRGERLVNITLDDAASQSLATIRTYRANCRDINGDGILDVPNPVLMPATSENTSYYMLEWYSYYSYGGRRLMASTYNNYADSWYLVLPREWIGHICVSREDGAAGERTIIFSTLNEEGGRGQDFLAVYTLTGANRRERGEHDGRFILHEEEETVYAAKILTDGKDLTLPVSGELLRENFRFLYSEWVTGET